MQQQQLAEAGRGGSESQRVCVGRHLRWATCSATPPRRARMPPRPPRTRNTTPAARPTARAEKASAGRSRSSDAPNLGGGENLKECFLKSSTYGGEEKAAARLRVAKVVIYDGYDGRVHLRTQRTDDSQSPVYAGREEKRNEPIRENVSARGSPHRGPIARGEECLCSDGGRCHVRHLGAPVAQERAGHARQPGEAPARSALRRGEGRRWGISGGRERVRQ